MTTCLDCQRELQREGCFMQCPGCPRCVLHFRSGLSVEGRRVGATLAFADLHMSPYVDERTGAFGGFVSFALCHIGGTVPVNLSFDRAIAEFLADEIAPRVDGLSDELVCAIGIRERHMEWAELVKQQMRAGEQPTKLRHWLREMFR